MLSVVGIKRKVEGRRLGKLQSVVKHRQGANMALTEQTRQQHMKSYYTGCAVARRNISYVYWTVHHCDS